ncbi:hypothetical protein QQ056_01135 [Oscillatoria laete-virens NRMC-F 0139]|nr:hypothetical protein [Oscillatoria laete-virens]MDL5052175.1 hypothetical protein [Oscillatoria laete-virens NRMC-F 0139]
MRKVVSGQPLRIPASIFNTLLDTAADFKSRSLNRNAASTPFDTKNGPITVRNVSGVDCDRFEALVLTSIVVAPSENIDEFYSRFAFDADLPIAGDQPWLVVLQEPIAAGALGTALVCGVSPVWLRRPVGENSAFCGIVADETLLKSGVPGAHILWEEGFSADEPHLALVRLPMDTCVIRMRVVSVHNNHLLCTRWIGSEWSTIEEKVAKPFLLRASITTRSGIVYTFTNPSTRTASQGGNTETQVIVPSYVANHDEIFAMPVPHTGVMESGRELTLMDLNVDGRAWAKKDGT